jgi:hypothetical protein
MRINLHWGISNLVSFTIIVTMLGNKQFLHGRRETVSLLDVLPRKEPCVHPPRPRDFPCRTSFRTHVTAGNMLPPEGSQRRLN